MARHRRSKQKRKTRKEINAAQDVENIWTDETDFSERLACVLNHIAVNEHFIQLRRKIYLSLDREQTLVHKAFGYNRRIYTFGSQIEGTTTTGMMSDTDTLQRFDTFHLYLDSENPPSQTNDHQDVIKVTTSGCSSQYCVLTMIELSRQARHKFDPNRDPGDIVNLCQRDLATTDGMIPHTIMFPQQHISILRHAKRHGPAARIGNIDSVYACYCKSLPKQCTFVFERPRPGHWPSERTLKKAKKYGVFIVPQGPLKSTNICTYDNFHFQWRISTNLTERLFMFSLDTVHLQAFVLTKMIKEELFMPEYEDRISTFHFKTAFFFAVENTRPDLWTEDNLINCVKYILAILRRFLTRRHCPHFIIGNVNLFVGKIERHEFPKMVDILTNIINSLRTKIEHIQMDNIGKTLNQLSARTSKRSRYFTNCSALFNYVLHIFQIVPQLVYGMQFSEINVNARALLFENECIRLETYYHAPSEKYRKYDYAFHGFMSVLASVGASVYLELKAEEHGYYHDGITKARQFFTQSLTSGIIGNYMPNASFLFCNGEYGEACTYFNLIEMQIEEDKKSNLIYQLFVSRSELLTLQIAKQSCEQSFKQRWSVFLIFRQAEAMCVPEFLRCEMYRGRFGTCTLSGMLQVNSNDDCICVQIEPYLYYLQYLTYRLLTKDSKRFEALMKLSLFTEIMTPTRFISSKIYIVVSHFDTSLNMLGHCLELEQKLESAWKTYKKVVTNATSRKCGSFAYHSTSLASCSKSANLGAIKIHSRSDKAMMISVVNGVRLKQDLTLRVIHTATYRFDMGA